MNIKEQLEAKKKELLDMEPALKDAEVTSETIEKAETISQEIADLEDKVEKAEKADAKEKAAHNVMHKTEKCIMRFIDFPLFLRI